MRIAVIGGAGHVGLPLSLLLAQASFKVTVVDIDSEKIGRIKGGQFPFVEEGGEEMLRQYKESILFTTEHSQVKNADAIILTVGTPRTAVTARIIFPQGQILKHYVLAV